MVNKDVYNGILHWSGCGYIKTTLCGPQLKKVVVHHCDYRFTSIAVTLMLIISTVMFSAENHGRHLRSADQGPNLQNFVKCTYENVMRELRIVSKTLCNSLVTL